MVEETAGPLAVLYDRIKPDTEVTKLYSSKALKVCSILTEHTFQLFLWLPSLLLLFWGFVPPWTGPHGLGLRTVNNVGAWHVGAWRVPLLLPPYLLCNPLQIGNPL